MAEGMTTLTYFDGRGRGEIIRIALSFANIPFREVHVWTPEDMTRLRKDGKLLFGQVPLLEIDGQKLVQTNSIVRYIGDKAGFIPKDLDKRTRMDILYDGTRDFAPHYLLPLGVEGQDSGQRNTAITRIQPTYLPTFNQALEENGTGYLVGDSITLADLGLLESLLNLEDYLGAHHMDEYPALKEFVKKMKSSPEGQTYMTKYRSKKNDEKLFSEVKATLPHLFK